MNRLGNVVPYIESSQQWPPAEVEAANDFAIKNWKVFFGVNIYSNGDIIYHVFLYLYVIW